MLAQAGDGPGIDLALSVGPAIEEGGGFLIGPAASLLMRDMTLTLPPSFVAGVRAFFGLTPKEAALAMHLAQGRTLGEAARAEAVAVATARAHLERIFRKTGTHQQSQLVAALRTLEGLSRR